MKHAAGDGQGSAWRGSARRLGSLADGSDALRCHPSNKGWASSPPRGLAGKPLAGFCTTPSRRITAVFGVIVYAIRFKTPSLHR